MAASNELVVDLSNKELSAIPEEVLQKCNDICSLDLSGNPEYQRLNSLRRFTHLRKLSLNRCALRWIPDKIRLLSKLEELQLDENDFSGGLPPVLWRLVQLKKLSLNDCGLRSLAENIGNLAKLEELKLGWNNFSGGLPSTIGRLVSLKKLYLNMCQLTTLPEDIGDLEQLEVLVLGNYRQRNQSIGNNFYQGLTPEIGRLSRLKHLDLNTCQLATLPASMKDLQKLETLLLGWNDFFVGGLPSVIGQLVQLKTLYLNNCGLRTIAKDIGNLNQLEVLILGNFRPWEPSRENAFSLKDFAFQTDTLLRLQLLDLKKCRLTTVPQSFKVCLTQIQELMLDENDFSLGLPTVIGQLVQLKKLCLNKCKLTTLPESIGNLDSLVELIIGYNNFNGCLPLVIGGLVRLKKLDVTKCKVTSLAENIEDLEQLEELILNENDFSGGPPTVIGRLVRLKKLHLNVCKLTTLAENIGELNQLEELLLDENDFFRGFPTAIGRLVQLQKLYLNKCKLTTLPESIGDLKQLKELQLGWNNFYRRLPPVIGRLVRLETLCLNNCKLTTLEENLGDLKQLSVLDLCKNKLREYPRCTLLVESLRSLNLSNASSANGDVPDDESDDQDDGANDDSSENKLSGRNMIGLYACCRKFCPDNAVDVVDHNGSKMNGNSIKTLPIELAHTSLKSLILDGNPITEPPEAIWKQGTKAIRSFMQAMIPGGSLMYADTLNMIGDTCAGKTSVAQSLVARSPQPTAEADRTHVLHQLAMKIDENSRQSVNINDFGGHDIYHSVIPIFLPANGLVILVFNLNDEKRKDHVKKWLMTALAKSSEIRVIIVGTHADQVGELRSDLEMQLLTFLAECLESAVNEVRAHINQLNSRSDVAHSKLTKLHQVSTNMQKALADFSQSAIPDIKTFLSHQTGRPDNTHTNQKNLRQLLVHLQDIVQKNPLRSTGHKNVVRFVTLSCVVADKGLDKMRNLVVSLLRPPETLPMRWCQVTLDILKQNDDYLYLTLKQIEDICRVHFTASDDSEAMKTILRYLAKTSQIIWLEDHTLLRRYVFHSPQKIIEACKNMLYHDSKMLLNIKKFYKSELEAYDRGILLEPLLKELLLRHVVHHNSGDEQAEPESERSKSSNVVLRFMEQFNLMSHVRTESGTKEYIVPSNLTPTVPSKLEQVERDGAECLNRVIVRLSFIGSIIPMSVFETSLSLILTVASKLPGYRAQPDVWRDGVIVLHDGVYFIAKRHDSVITFVAFSKPSCPSPWTILHPVLKTLSDNVRSSWNGAPPHSTVVCPNCARRTQLDNRVSQLGEIQDDLTRLAATYVQGEIRPMCREFCLATIPQSLCYATMAAGSFTNDQSEIEEFFRKCGQTHEMATPQESSLQRKKLLEPDTAKRVNSLQENMRRMTSEFHDKLVIGDVQDLAQYVYAQKKLNRSAWETINHENNPRRAKHALISNIEAGGDSAIQCFAEALRYIERFDLANDLCSNGQTDQHDAAARS